MQQDFQGLHLDKIFREMVSEVRIDKEFRYDWYIHSSSVLLTPEFCFQG